MIQVKTFVIPSSSNILHHEKLERQINSFLVENDIEVIDIKYSTCSSWNGTGNIWSPSAMLIYKTK